MAKREWRTPDTDDLRMDTLDPTRRITLTPKEHKENRKRIKAAKLDDLRENMISLSRIIVALSAELAKALPAVEEIRAVRVGLGTVVSAIDRATAPNGSGPGLHELETMLQNITGGISQLPDIARTLENVPTKWLKGAQRDTIIRVLAAVAHVLPGT